MKKLSKYFSIILAFIVSAVPATTHAMRMYQDDFQGMMPPGDGVTVAGPVAGGMVGAGVAMAVIMMLLMIIFWVGIILLWVFWLVMVIDIVKRDWKNSSDRVAYLILVILLNILGAIIYYFAVKRHLNKANVKK